MYIVLAIFWGLFINYFFWWFEFNPVLCLVAGIFLVMPALLKFSFKDLFILKDHKKITFLNIVLNFLIIPAIFYFIWDYFFDIEYIKYAFLLLWILSWGWLLLTWARETKSDLKLTFSLFILNFIIFSALFFPLNDFLILEGEKYTATLNQNVPSFLVSQTEEAAACGFADVITSCWFSWWSWPSPIAAFFALILIPFIFSRIIILSSSLEKYLSWKINIISKISTFIVIFYIFSLKEIHNIFDLNPYFIFKTIGALLVAYMLVYSIMYFIYIYGWKTSEYKSLFWVTATRFITLWLIFSFVYSAVFWVEFLIIFSLAYFVQVFLSVMFSKILKK